MRTLLRICGGLLIAFFVFGIVGDLVACGGGSNVRKKAMRIACIHNLRQIDAAKEAWTNANEDEYYEDPIPIDLAFINGHEPKCPAGGKYEIGNANGPPTCTIPGHSLGK
jgi:hypothetical protein